MKFRELLAAALLLGFSLGATTATPIAGTFALQGGSPKVTAHLRATPIGSDPLAEHLDIWMTPPGSAGAIAHYAVDMTKLLHVIVVSDDFTQFLHIHPVLGSDGHFTIDQRFPKSALYHVYADGEPQPAGHQVFRFDLPVGPGARPATRSLTPSGATVAAGPYRVQLSTTTVKAGSNTPLVVHIRRAGRPAGDLHPYLGALAHCVFLDAADLTYVHVHPMKLGGAPMGGMTGMNGMAGMSGMGGMGDMGSMEHMDMAPMPDSATSSPDMQLDLVLREPGTYKLWLQFRGGGALEVAPFVITAT